jgi:adenine phosphoribosyltransferase
MNLKDAIKTYPDFPKPGVMFRDINSMLRNPEHFNEALNQIEALVADLDYDLIIAPESRGFFLSAPIAARQNKGLVLARKKGKLPGPTLSRSYELEYGTDTIEVCKFAIKPGQKAIIIDDLLATGGTAKCICEIAKELGGEVLRAVFLIELTDLKGREVLSGYCDIKAAVEY